MLKIYAKQLLVKGFKIEDLAHLLSFGLNL